LFLVVITFTREAANLYMKASFQTGNWQKLANSLLTCELKTDL